MQPEEIAAKQQQASELQDELRKQIEDKKRVKVTLCIACCRILTANAVALTLHISDAAFGQGPNLSSCLALLLLHDLLCE